MRASKGYYCSGNYTLNNCRVTYVAKHFQKGAGIFIQLIEKTVRKSHFCLEYVSTMERPLISLMHHVRHCCHCCFRGLVCLCEAKSVQVVIFHFISLQLFLFSSSNLAEDVCCVGRRKNCISLRTGGSRSSRSGDS